MTDTVKPALLGMIPTSIPGYEQGLEECWVYVKAGRLELRHASYEGEPDAEMTALTLDRYQACALGTLILAAAPLLLAPAPALEPPAEGTYLAAPDEGKTTLLTPRDG